MWIFRKSSSTGMLAATLAVLLSAGGSAACDFCLLSQGISPLDTIKGSGIKINERYTLLDRVYQGTDRLKVHRAEETHWTTEFTGFYSPTGRLTLFAVIPYRVSKTEGELALPEEGGPPELDAAGAGNASGIGDIALLARHTFLFSDSPKGSLRLAGQVGIKLATGRTNAKTDDGEEFLDSHIQPGTGSTDLLFGLSFNHGTGRFSLAGNLLGTICAEGEFGDTRHQFGNALNYDLSGKYRVHPWANAPRDPQLFLVLGVNGELRGKEKVDGEIEENSGGNTVYLSPGLQLTLPRHWVLDFTYQGAVYHNLKGTQLGETSKVVAGITYLL